METVNQIINRPQQNSQQTWSGEQKEMINKIFATIKVFYPTSAWKNQDESQTKRMWLAHLSKESSDHVDKALLALVDHYPTFAPTLGEFKKLLRDMNVKKAKFFEREALPPPRNRNVGLQAIKNMKAILK
jgi:hypothetical protein